MKMLWKSFQEGFVGAFVLAAAIIMAVISVATSFTHGDSGGHRRHGEGSTQM